MSATLVRARQRRTVRRAARVDCQVVRERDFKLLGSRGLDLSRCGMLVLAQAPVLTGEPVIVAFRLPQSAWWFDAQGTVARVVHGRRAGDLGRCFGVAFDALAADACVFLARVLGGLPPPVPRRAPRIDYAATVRLVAKT
jgi:hypothetical protein